MNGVHSIFKGTAAAVLSNVAACIHELQLVWCTCTLQCTELRPNHNHPHFWADKQAFVML